MPQMEFFRRLDRIFGIAEAEEKEAPSILKSIPIDPKKPTALTPALTSGAEIRYGDYLFGMSSPEGAYGIRYMLGAQGQIAGFIIPRKMMEMAGPEIERHGFTKVEKARSTFNPSHPTFQRFLSDIYGSEDIRYQKAAARVRIKRLIMNPNDEVSLNELLGRFPIEQDISLNPILIVDVIEEAIRELRAATTKHKAITPPETPSSIQDITAGWSKTPQMQKTDAAAIAEYENLIKRLNEQGMSSEIYTQIQDFMKLHSSQLMGIYQFYYKKIENPGFDIDAPENLIRVRELNLAMSEIGDYLERVYRTNVDIPQIKTGERKKEGIISPGEMYTEDMAGEEKVLKLLTGIRDLIIGFDGLLLFYNSLFNDTEFESEFIKIAEEYKNDMAALHIKRDEESAEKMEGVQDKISRDIVNLFSKVHERVESPKTKGTKEEKTERIRKKRLDLMFPAALFIKSAPPITKEQLRREQSAQELQRKEVSVLIDKGILGDEYREMEPEELEYNLWKLKYASPQSAEAEALKKAGISLSSPIPPPDDVNMRILDLAELDPRVIEMTPEERIGFILKKLSTDEHYYDIIPADLRRKIHQQSTSSDFIFVLIDPTAGKKDPVKRPKKLSKPKEKKEPKYTGYIVKFFIPKENERVFRVQSRFSDIINKMRNLPPYKGVFIPFVRTDSDPSGRNLADKYIEELKRIGYVIQKTILTTQRPRPTPDYPVYQLGEFIEYGKEKKEKKPAEEPKGSYIETEVGRIKRPEKRKPIISPMEKPREKTPEVKPIKRSPSPEPIPLIGPAVGQPAYRFLPKKDSEGKKAPEMAELSKKLGLDDPDARLESDVDEPEELPKKPKKLETWEL